jgi:cellulose biosynthesis protein BcsQ
VNKRGAEGVLLTGVYGSGKSSVAAEIAYLLERRDEPYALLDLDYLGWAGTGTGDRAGEFGAGHQQRPSDKTGGAGGNDLPRVALASESTRPRIRSCR